MTKSLKFAKILTKLMELYVIDGQVTSCNAESESCVAKQLLSEFKLVKRRSYLVL